MCYLIMKTCNIIFSIIYLFITRWWIKCSQVICWVKKSDLHSTHNHLLLYLLTFRWRRPTCLTPRWTASSATVCLLTSGLSSWPSLDISSTRRLWKPWLCTAPCTYATFQLTRCGLCDEFDSCRIYTKHTEQKNKISSFPLLKLHRSKRLVVSDKNSINQSVRPGRR